MTRGSNHEYMRTIRDTYHRADRQGKTALLTQAVQITGYHRKHVLRHLRASPTPSQRPRRARRSQASPEVIDALRLAWNAADRICAKRLQPFLPDLVASLERHGAISMSPTARATLLRLSPATIDRLLAPTRARIRPHGLSTTKPGTLLLAAIPLRTFAEWDDARPGFLEVDLVAHCGETAAGEFAYTLNAVDIGTGWSECVALLGRSQRAVFAAIQTLQARLPVPLLGLDSDNDSAFINDILYRYCVKEHITFTRSRPYRKNDQAHVEQKNWSIVRRLVGYDRYETPAAVEALNTLYGPLRLYTNFFQPSMKLVHKTRRGAKVHKRYDRAQTPYQRLLSSGCLTLSTTQELAASYANLNPIAVRQEIQRHLQTIWTLVAR